MPDHDPMFHDRRLVLLALLAVFLIGVSLRFDLFRSRSAELQPGTGGGVFPPPPEGPIIDRRPVEPASPPAIDTPQVPTPTPAPKAEGPKAGANDANTIDDLLALFEGKGGGKAGKAFAEEFAKNPTLTRALDRLKTTRDISAFVDALQKSGAFYDLLRRHAGLPGFKEFAERLANNPALAPLVSKNKREQPTGLQRAGKGGSPGDLGGGSAGRAVRIASGAAGPGAHDVGKLASLERVKGDKAAAKYIESLFASFPKEDRDKLVDLCLNDGLCDPAQACLAAGLYDKCRQACDRSNSRCNGAIPPNPPTPPLPPASSVPNAPGPLTTVTNTGTGTQTGTGTGTGTGTATGTGTNTGTQTTTACGPTSTCYNDGAWCIELRSGWGWHSSQPACDYGDTANYPAGCSVGAVCLCPHDANPWRYVGELPNCVNK